MTIAEAKQMRKFAPHEDKLYADFNFPDYSDEEMISWYKIKTENGRVLIGIKDMQDNVIGYMTLRKINNFFKTSEMGIIINPEKINMGYGTDAINSLKRLSLYRRRLSTSFANNYSINHRRGCMETGLQVRFSDSSTLQRK